MRERSRYCLVPRPEVLRTAAGNGQPPGARLPLAEPFVHEGKESMLEDP